MAIIQRLVAQLGFEIDDKGLKDFQKSVKEIERDIIKLSVAATAAAAGIFALTKITANESDQLSRTSQQIGISTKSLQEYAKAAEIAGHAPDELIGALVTLKKKAEDSRFGDLGAIQGFSRLGVSIRNANGDIKSSEALLDSVADKLSAIGDPTIKRKILSDLGINENLLPLLAKGSAGLSNLRQEAAGVSYIFTDQDKENLREFNKNLTLALSSITALGKEFSAKLAPAFTVIFKLFKDFIGTNKEFISSGIDKFVAVLSGLMEGLGRILGVLFDAFKGLSNLIGGELAFALLAISGLLTVINAKTLLLIGALAAVYLVIDDLIVFFKGGNSITGLIVDSMKQMFDALDKYVTNLISVEWPKKIGIFVQTIKNDLIKTLPIPESQKQKLMVDPNSSEYKTKQVVGGIIGNIFPASKYVNDFGANKLLSFFATNAITKGLEDSKLNDKLDSKYAIPPQKLDQFSRIGENGAKNLGQDNTRSGSVAGKSFNQTNNITINSNNPDVLNLTTEQIQKNFNDMMDEMNRNTTFNLETNIVK